MLSLVASSVGYAPAAAMAAPVVTRAAAPQMFGQSDLQGEPTPNQQAPNSRSLNHNMRLRAPLSHADPHPTC